MGRSECQRRRNLVPSRRARLRFGHPDQELRLRQRVSYQGIALNSLRKKSDLRLFWVAQRFTAAITGLFSASALAAAVTLRREKHFFRSLFSDTESRARSAAPLGDERPPGNSSQSASDRHHRRPIRPNATMTSDPAKPELSTL